jgi:hypothetical protein
MNNKVFIALAFLVMVAVACSPTPFLADTKRSIGDVGISSGTILYQDNFTDTNSGWLRDQTPDYTMDYANGGYRIYVTTIKIMAFSPAKPYLSSDVSVEVDATKTGGPDDNYIGVICRYQDENNYYFFAISSDGFAGIAMYKANQMSMLTGNSFKYSSAIAQGAATNHIRADCIGNSLTLYINGQKVASIDDSTFSDGGQAGLLASANSIAGVDILFSNFVVRKP